MLLHILLELFIYPLIGEELIEKLHNEVADAIVADCNLTLLQEIDHSVNAVEDKLYKSFVISVDTVLLELDERKNKLNIFISLLSQEVQGEGVQL